MSLPELEFSKFKIEPDPGDLTSIDLGIRKNVSTTNVNAPLEDDQSSLFTYVVWIFLAFLTYPVVPPYLLSTGNEDTIFDPGISIYHSSMPDVSHRSGTFMKFNVYPNHLNERLVCCDIHRKRGRSEKIGDDEFIRQDIRRLFYGRFSFYDPNVDIIKEVKQPVTKPLAPKAAPVTKPVATKASKSQQPKLAPAMPQEKKRKLLIDEFVDEGIPVNEPRFDDEEDDVQKAVEESLKDVHAAHQGPLPPVVFREPDSGRRQPLPETPKDERAADQYIFIGRRTSIQTEPSGHDESSSLYAKLGLTNNEMESDEEVLIVIQSGASR
ncbi:hypothetical protein Tco_0093616 [Tanacetum coccineum]